MIIYIYTYIYIHDSMIIFHMVICWFSSLPSPNAPRISYEVGTVEEHSPPLRVERSPAGGAFAGVLREEFLVQTKVSRGSREAPWELKGVPYIPAGGIFALTKVSVLLRKSPFTTAPTIFHDFRISFSGVFLVSPVNSHVFCISTKVL